ncbi:unnamed protein product [Penicillium salamii]|uniref:Uncharacterized protein n=1 Tax=Penicillium salamii TaxID=1612424 RepID=A0A9W4K304_9EURO|nr:unnamed protein product [Penicillium salamii]CAG8312379.1 unnamed protein product [Penicillium salamii]CAG8328135.1 unnamed protein product [Penicillium salamii]CAG8425435.1 unnamed protein product [Penicillium salamii]CAG8429241.1 unnamed protein product [Penicillium salamii]
MNTQNSSADQEFEDQQPSELPILGEKDNSLETSDHVPLDTEARNPLAKEPFQPILKVLADLEPDDPKFAVPAARLVGLYRRLW